MTPQNTSAEEQRLKTIAALRACATGAKEEADALFDPRTEISADAQHIVKHLWTIFIVVPVVCALLYGIFSGMNH